jgi:hypothetical protein
MKKLFFALFLGILAIIPVHAQQTVIVHRPGIFSDLANVTGAIVALPVTMPGLQGFRLPSFSPSWGIRTSP